jgi:addiction module HigA family antidote
MRPIHPGEILREELQEAGLSARQLAKALGVPVNRVTSILREERGITADTALRLARYFGSTPEFWLNLQSAYDLRHAQQAVGKVIAREVKPRVAA